MYNVFHKLCSSIFRVSSWCNDTYISGRFTCSFQAVVLLQLFFHKSICSSINQSKLTCKVYMYLPKCDLISLFQPHVFCRLIFVHNKEPNFIRLQRRLQVRKRRVMSHQHFLTPESSWLVHSEPSDSSSLMKLVWNLPTPPQKNLGVGLVWQLDIKNQQVSVSAIHPICMCTHVHELQGSLWSKVRFYEPRYN